MNSIVRSWNKQRIKHGDAIVADLVAIDGVEFRIDGMADRGRLPNQDMAMTEQHVKNVVAVIHSTSLGRVRELKEIIYRNHKRLQLKKDPSLAIREIGEGSVQIDFGTIAKWADTLTIKDVEACEQLRIFYATILTRVGV